MRDFEGHPRGLLGNLPSVAVPSSANQGHDAGTAPLHLSLVLGGQRRPWILPFRRLRLKQLEVSFVRFKF